MENINEIGLLAHSRNSNKNGGEEMRDDSTISSEFQISVASAQGGRKYMEDRLHIEIGRDNAGGLDFVFAAIYDGHGGIHASDYVRRHLFDNIVNNQAFHSEDDQDVLEAIRAGFLKTHLNMQKAAEQWPPTSTGFPCTAGTTATCAFIRKGKLYTGHVGDSAIILANFLEEETGYNDAKLTEDHKPETKSERNRIEKAGGAVAVKSGISRVIWKRPIRGHRGPVRRSTNTESIPFLAVSRSLGDFWSLNPDNNQYIVSPEPDVDVFRLKGSDNFLVFASDGLTNVVGVRAIIQVLREVEAMNKNQKQRVPSLDAITASVDNRRPLNYAHCLLQNAFKKWGSLRADNISVICIKLNAEAFPEGHPSIAGQISDTEVGKRLTEQPFTMIHVNQTTTLQLSTNPLRHIYSGTLDKGLNFQSIRFGRSINGNANVLLHRRDSQQNQEHFSGPGFVVPEMLIEDNQMAGVGGTGSRSSLYGNGSDYNEGESDAEEVKHLDEGGQRADEEIELAEELPGPSALPQLFSPRKNIQKAQKKPMEMATQRVGVKRRMQDSEDGYMRHIPKTSGAPTSQKVCLEEVQEEEEEQEPAEVKPPPAKRSRLQSVLNFFTNLLKW